MALFPTAKVRSPRSGAVAERNNPTSTEWWLHGCNMRERSYTMLKVRRGRCEEIDFI